MYMPGQKSVGKLVMDLMSTCGIRVKGNKGVPIAVLIVVLAIDGQDMEAEAPTTAAWIRAAPLWTALGVAYGSLLDSAALVFLTTSLTFDECRYSRGPAWVQAIGGFNRTPIAIPSLEYILCALRGCLQCRYDLTCFDGGQAFVNEPAFNMSWWISFCKQVTGERISSCFLSLP
jgi:hypothetical protein